MNKELTPVQQAFRDSAHVGQAFDPVRDGWYLWSELPRPWVSYEWLIVVDQFGVE